MNLFRESGWLWQLGHLAVVNGGCSGGADGGFGRF